LDESCISNQRLDDLKLHVQSAIVQSLI